eukprot:1415801-Prymnesium_polylepis.2
MNMRQAQLVRTQRPCQTQRARPDPPPARAVARCGAGIATAAQASRRLTMGAQRWCATFVGVRRTA